jgi:FkbM family methyltransferase
MKYYSQYNQDYWIDQLLEQKEKGVFLDIGANDGITISNSYFFEKNRNWEGICVEPLANVFAKLDKNRECHKVNACVSDKNGKEVFFRIEGYTEMLSGLRSEYHDTHWQRILADVAAKGDRVFEYEVDCIAVNDLLAKHSYRDIDFLSLDTEGSELKILKAIDYGRFNFSIICVENPYNDKGFEQLLSKHGFVLCTTLQCDYLFVNKANTRLYQKALPHIRRTRVNRAYLMSRKLVKGVLMSVGLWRKEA